MNKPVEDSGRLLSDIRKEFADLRREIDNVIAQVGMQTDTQKLMSELDDKILHVVNEHQKSTDGTMAMLSEIVARQELALSHVYYQLAEINRVQSQLNHLGHVAPLIPVGPFCSRLLGEERHARSEVAKHVVQKYFVEPSKKQNCFVQASSLAFDLFRHIDILDGVTHYCLFHVNGPVAALPLQFGHNNGKHCVVPFWGAIFDTSCAAYIPPSSDEKAIEELRKLFQRPKDPLNQGSAFFA